MKRRVVMNMNKTTSKGKIVRQCSNNVKTSSLESLSGKKNKAPNPTLKCHEEVMSRLSQCTPDYCHNDLDHFSEKNEHFELKAQTDRKHKHRKHVNKNSSDPKRKDFCEADYGPVNYETNFRCTKTVRSKSVPTVQKSKVEDYVDYIPVKLSSKEETKENQSKGHKMNYNSNLDAHRRARSFRPTWDTLLKGESQIKLNPIETKRLSNPSDIVGKNSVSDGSSSERPTSKQKETLINSPKDKSSLGKGDAESPNTILLTNRSDMVLSNQFCGVEPVKTLDFLIKHLREKLCKQPENENLQKIISDMENVLLKISVENNAQPISIQEDKSVPSTNSSSPHFIPKSAVSSSNHKETNHRLDIHQLQSKLEESCIFLQSLCMKQRENCTSHTKEKELLTIQLAESRRLLAIAKSKEKDYEVTIGNLRLKCKEAESRSEQQAQYIKELNSIITKLQAENQILHSYEDTIRKLNGRVKELTKEKESLNSNLKDLEIEKLKFLLERKENVNPVQSNKAIGKYGRPIEEELNVGGQLDNKDISSISLTSETNWTQDKNIIACSSQASSSPRRSPTPYNSWQHISAIYQQPSEALEINKNIPNIFETLKRKYDTKYPSPLDLELPSSDNSMLGDKDEINSKFSLSDFESEKLSS